MISVTLLGIIPAARGEAEHPLRIAQCAIIIPRLPSSFKKTERTRRDVLPIEIYLLDDALAILNRWKVKETSPSDYVFGLTSDQYSLEEQYRLKGNFIRSINYYMKKLAQLLGIKSKLTTYVARHSYATMLKNLGVSVEEISESLGHNSIETTRNYLASFSQNRKKSTAEKLQNAL